MALLRMSQESSLGAVSAKNTNTPALDQYGRDLTEMPERQAGPHYRREKEIEHSSIHRRTKNNRLLLVTLIGKTAIAEGLAQKIYRIFRKY